jgi:hypothetical protein
MTARQMEAAHTRAKGLVEKESWEEACRCLSEVLQEPLRGDKGWTDMLLAMRGQCLVALRRYEDALADFSRVGRTQYDARVCRAALLSLRLDRFDEALALIGELFRDSYVVVKHERAAALKRAQAFAMFHTGDALRAAELLEGLFVSALTDESSESPPEARVDRATLAGLQEDLERVLKTDVAPEALQQLTTKLDRKLKLHRLRAKKRTS